MARVDKIRIGESDYDMSPAPNGTLDTSEYSSSDVVQASATEWSSVDKLNNTDSNKSIFSKVSMMFKNIRYLHNVMGSGFTTSSTISSQLSGKADSSHSHTTSTLPVSSTQVNSTAYIPTSSLVYSMNESINSLNDASAEHESRITSLEAESGGSAPSPVDPSTLPTPPSTYSNTKIGTWSSSSDVDTFFNTYTPANGWSGLQLGNYITINDGSYNVNWYIAGFNCETIHNGAKGGIAFIPKTNLTTQVWDFYINTTYIRNPYAYSLIHSYINSTVKSSFTSILGNHLMKRKVKLGASLNKSTCRTTSTIDTNTYFTLLSTAQLGFTAGSYYTTYDDGEANYKLPIFNSLSTSDYANSEYVWLRNVYGLSSSTFYAWSLRSGGTVLTNYVSDTNGVRPLMYLR